MMLSQSPIRDPAQGEAVDEQRLAAPVAVRSDLRIRLGRSGQRR